MNDCIHLRREKPDGSCDWQCLLRNKEWFCPWDDDDPVKKLCEDYEKKAKK